MAEIAKSGTPSLSSRGLDPNDQLSGLLAGEAIAAGDAVYVKSDGLVYKADLTSSSSAASLVVRGFALVAAQSGEAVTFAWNVRLRYGAGLTPGARYYLSGTVIGGLTDVAGDASGAGGATHAGSVAVAYAVDATRIFVSHQV